MDAGSVISASFTQSMNIGCGCGAEFKIALRKRADECACRSHNIPMNSFTQGRAGTHSFPLRVTMAYFNDFSEQQTWWLSRKVRADIESAPTHIMVSTFMEASQSIYLY
jgi:hypothetical protein